MAYWHPMPVHWLHSTVREQQHIASWKKLNPLYSCLHLSGFPTHHSFVAIQTQWPPANANTILSSLLWHYLTKWFEQDSMSASDKHNRHGTETIQHNNENHNTEAPMPQKKITEYGGKIR